MSRKPLDDALQDIRKEVARGRDANAEALKEHSGVPSLPVDKVHTAVSVFQPRTLDGQLNASEEHITDLCRALALGGDLDPITVWWSGKRFYVVDGHHRLLAYKRFTDKHTKEKRRYIPVVALRGTLEEAMAFAAKANSKNKLAMTQDDKSSMAWRLVCLTELTNKEIAAACSVGVRSVTRQRSVLKGLLEEHKGHTQETLAELRWFQVRMLMSGKPDDQDPDEKLKADIEYMAKRLRKEHGTKLMKVPQVFAGAIAQYDDRLPGTLVATPQWENLLDKHEEEHGEEHGEDF